MTAVVNDDVVVIKLTSMERDECLWLKNSLVPFSKLGESTGTHCLENDVSWSSEFV